MAGAKLHLCRSLLPASTLDGDTARIRTHFSTSQRVDCSSRSEVVEFVFIHPEARLEWADAAFRIGRGSLLSQATEAIHTGVQPARYDERSHALLYSIHVLGMSTAEPAFIRSAIMAATSAPIVPLESVEPDGAAGFGVHKWAITSASTECPEELQRTRMFRVTAADILT